MTAYADTSFLASLYGRDVNSPEAVKFMESLDDSLFVTPFSEVELLTAFEACAFRRLVTVSQAEASMRAFRSDLSAGVLVRKALPHTIFARAMLLSGLYTRLLGCRTLDILQISIAVDLNAELFLTFDKDQAKLARRAGLSVRPGR